jgi:hypothetical protein
MANINDFDMAEIMQRINYGTIPEAINKVMQTTAAGAIDTAIGDSYFGINHRQTPGPVGVNKDNYGLTFFVKPRMNLTTANLVSSRQLSPLLTKQPASIQRVIRLLLDHQLITKEGLKSPLVDPQMGFIPILSNHLLSMNGWPDVSVDTFSSQDGVYKEAWAMVDSVAQNYSIYDITANFRNTPGSPITLLFFAWIHYMSMVYQGIMVPYFEHIVEQEMDYNTRIYRLVLDQSKRFVTGIAACGAALPISTPIGSMFNFNSEKPYNDEYDQISIQFRCMGAMYKDDILVYEFNRVTELFNDTMGDRYRTSMYRVVPFEFLSIFNYRGYPRIDPDTYELQWWVPKDEYNARLGLINDFKQRGV